MGTLHPITSGGPVMAIFAHPDDVEFLCGGSVALWSAAGRELVFVFCTDGSKGTKVPTLQGDALVAARKEEQRVAGALLGCTEFVFLPNQDAMLEPTLDLRRDLTGLIRTYKPQTVLCFDPTVYWIGDSYLQHPDHRASGEAALAAIFPSARDRPTFPELAERGLEPHNVLDVYMASPAQANAYFDITTTIDVKIEAMRAHKSQIADPEQTGHILRQRAQETGAAVGVAYAEAFRYVSMDPAARLRPRNASGENPA